MDVTVQVLVEEQEQIWNTIKRQRAQEEASLKLILQLKQESTGEMWQSKASELSDVERKKRKGARAAAVFDSRMFRMA